MTRRVLLDTGPLGKATHPRPNKEFAGWLESLLASEVEVIIPEIADYELRREYVRRHLKEGTKPQSLDRLNGLKERLTYLPLDTATMHKAAENWAKARNRGRPMADKRELDCDAILAAQAQLAGATIATENVGHLDLFVEAKSWRNISPQGDLPD